MRYEYEALEGGSVALCMPNGLKEMENRGEEKRNENQV
jgi:hypothetical protein